MKVNLRNLVFMVNLFVILSGNVFANENQAVVIATSPEVAQCNLLTTIDTLPTYNKNIDWLKHALHEVLLKAENIGATHVVIESVQTVGVFNGTVTATAYLCKKT